MDSKNKRRNFPEGGSVGGKREVPLIRAFFSYNFCRNSDNARAHFPFPIPHEPVVILLSLFRFVA